MKNFSLLILVLFMAQGLYAQSDLSKLKDELIKTDSDFSAMSKEKGRNAAFLAYAADDAVMLRPNGYPMKGIAEIKERFSKVNDSTFTLIWKPLYADAAASGELGYTYGTYDLLTKDEKGNPLHLDGTYATVWKKDKSGNWKFVLDVGNEGLKPKK